MEVLNQPARLKKLLKEYEIPQRFDSQNLNFRLLRYPKGETIFSPFRMASDLLFLVHGTVQIYAIHPDGELSPVGLRLAPCMMGEIDFITRQPSQFYVEAKTEVLCIALSLTRYGEELHRDIRFLNSLLTYLADHMDARAVLETEHHTLREQVLFYFEQMKGEKRLTSVNGATMLFHCSRRQLQRVLADLCEEGLLRKEGKGRYIYITPSPSTDEAG